MRLQGKKYLKLSDHLNYFIQRYYDAVAVALEDAYPGKLTVKGNRDPGTTGNFEIVLVPTGELIHSKTTRGQGKCSTQEEIDAVIAKVGAYLNTL